MIVLNIVLCSLLQSESPFDDELFYSQYLVIVKIVFTIEKIEKMT